jgi:outer membrane protein assembly factor BamB
MVGRVAGAIALIFVALSAAQAADWVQWGGSGSRNMVSSETGLPSWFDPSLTGPTPSGNLRWSVKLGNRGYSTPVVAGGKVFIGTSFGDNPYCFGRKLSGGGAVMCFDESTGKFLWQLAIPKYTTRDSTLNLGHTVCGVCSTAAVDGDRLYIVSSRDELLCMDVNGQSDGNRRPFTNESAYMGDPGNRKLAGTDGDIIWRLDMIADKRIQSHPNDAADCSALILGNLLYVSPCNGMSTGNKRVTHPNAPNLIAVDKRTGRLVARDRTRMGSKIFHGSWSSPSAGRVGGRDLVFYGGGDGVCYAFDARPVPPAKGQPMGSLKTVWQFDVNAAAGRRGQYLTYSGPSEIIATPVFYKNRVYVATGQDPTHRNPGGLGALVCIDAARRGDITRSGKVWLFKGIGRSLSTVAIANGLVYAADNVGRVYCLDAETGKLYWKRDTKQTIWSSPMVADGKVYVGTDSGDLWVFATGMTPRLIRKFHVGTGITATATAANGVLYVATRTRLYAAAVDGKRSE